MFLIKNIFKDTSNYNMNQRLTEIAKLVRQFELFKNFHINDYDIKQMYKSVNNTIICWKGISLNCNKNEKKTYREYKKASTNWFNRTKPKIYGNYFFYPLIYIHILNVKFYCVYHVNVDCEYLFFKLHILLFGMISADSMEEA